VIAIQAAQACDAEGLRPTELPKPVPAADEVLVKVAIAGVNFADTMQRRDRYFLPVRFPFIPGEELAGTIETVGDSVRDWKKGDRIAGLRMGGGGAYAQYATLSVNYAARIPDDLEFALATAVLNQGLTAQGIVESMPEISKGASVLVTAAAGGVGGLLLQLLKRAGAGTIVAAAGDTTKLEFAAKNGAKTVSYNVPDWARTVRTHNGGRGVDVAIDAIGGEVRHGLLASIAPRGRLLFYGAASGSMGIDETSLIQLLGKNLSLTGYSIFTSMREDTGWLARTSAELFALVARGVLHIPKPTTFSMKQAPDAHKAIESRQTQGKVLIAMDQS